MVKLSIVMPAYNESATIVLAIERVLQVDYPCPVELIVVDDGSSDDTAALLERFTARGLRLVRHPRNLGKGAAVRTGVEHSTGTHMIIFDADLEYSPSDIPAMLRPVLDGRADHVFGARIFGFNTRYTSFRFAAGGRALTLVANLLYDSCLTDMHTCLKLLPVEDFQTLRLSEDGFGLDTELTARLIRGGVRPYEVPISYNGRSFEEGKKIGWRDGVHCLSILTKVRAERFPQALPAPSARAAVAESFPGKYVLPMTGTTGDRAEGGWRVTGPHPEVQVLPTGEADTDDAAVAI
ncbi:glycosyltransferase family 2 protein [Amycolatopsis sp. H20-H5]|uniref:glycosyltransferase family 2 protein n=1 Tax=Amycolatopsis sp. H20-H5 TaxID=3046309 RepID=UPI002DBB3EDC|nr:glycosyltransferase family 2 protein [Amycolatopsis sp. H20-H5]MEC3980059.1 glycosyltransferase family 2 protein [Amycolatopsis sp. H20-H5]